MPHGAVAVFQAPHDRSARPRRSSGRPPTGSARRRRLDLVDAPLSGAAAAVRRADRRPADVAAAGDADGPPDGDVDEFDLSPFEHLVKPADPPAPAQRPASTTTPNLPESVGGTPFAGHPPTRGRRRRFRSRAAGIPSQPHGYADGPVAARVVDHIDYAYEVDSAGPVPTRVDDEALVSDDAWFAGVDAPPGVPMNRRARTATPALPPAPDATPASSGRELVPADLAPPSPPSGKTAAPKTKDRDPAVELAISEIAGHLTFTPSQRHRVVLRCPRCAGRSGRTPSARR